MRGSRPVLVRTAPVLVALGGLLCALAAHLARPRPAGDAAPSRPGLRAVVVDASGSARRTRMGWSRWVNRRLRSEARAALETGEDLAVVLFADGARVAAGPGPAGDLLDRLEGRGEPFTPGLPPAQQLASRLDEGVALAESALREPGRARGRLVLIVDRTATGPDPAPRLAGLVRDGFGLTWYPLPPEDRPDLELHGLRLPGFIEAGVAWAGRVELALSSGARARSLVLEIEVRGPGAPAPRHQVLTVPDYLVPGEDGRLRWTQRFEVGALEPGLQRVTVTGRLPGDAIGENDRVGSNLRVGRELVALASAPADLAPSLQDWVKAPGMHVIWRAPEAIGLDLDSADVLLTFDLGPADLPEALPEFVRAGGGWVAALGWRALGSWERHGAGGANDLLPLVPSRESGRSRDVILLVDGSGSMVGERFERVRSAVFELVPAASPRDRIELRFFTEVLGPSVFRSQGQTASDRRRSLAPLLDAKVPRGGTDIGYSLRALAKTRGHGDRPGLVLLITDGRGSSLPGGATRASLAEARLDLRVLHVGDDLRGLGFLDQLLLPGERVVPAGDLSDLARLLQLAVNHHRVRDDPGMSALLGTAEGELGRALLPAMVAAVADAPVADSPVLGPIGTYARAEAAPGAEVLWRSSVEGEPLLAVRREGAGLVGALATHPGWAGFLGPDLLDPLWRAAGRGRPPKGPRLEDGPDGLVLEDCPLDWPLDLVAQVGLPPQGGLAGGEGGPPLAEIPLRPGPGGTALDPRRRRVGPRGAFLEGLRRGAGLEVRLVGAGRRLATLPLVAAGPAEWFGGGTRVGPPGALPPVDPRPDPLRTAPHPGAGVALAAGLVLLAVGGLLAVLGGQGIGGLGRR
jgi:Mg-chelatase subunit ChlD